MSHNQTVLDTDPHFTIDPITREILCENQQEIILIQRDHNSQRVTFDIPRYVDGHDMTCCNRVRVHYINIDKKTEETNEGIYHIDDVRISPEDDNTVCCSWLISRNATKFVGLLSFAIHFECFYENEVQYSWGTKMRTGVTVYDTIDNTDIVFEEYKDVLETWYSNTIANLTEVANNVLETIPDEYTELEGRVDELEIKKFNTSDVVQTTGDSETVVMSQKAVTAELGKLSEEIESDSKFLHNEIMMNRHFKPIMYDFCTKGTRYKEVNGEIVEVLYGKCSGKFPAPKNLCMSYTDDSSAIVNFYTRNSDGTYTPYHALLNTVTSDGVMHVVSYALYKLRMISDIPDGMYMEICEIRGKVEFYAWDGEMFGMDASANLSYPTTSETETWLNAGGGSGVTIHGKAKHLLAKNAKIRLVQGFKNSEITILDTTNKKYYELPNGYDYFRFRFETDDNGTEPKSVSGDVSDYICVVADVAEEFPISNAEKVIELCRKVTNLRWKPSKNVVVNNNTSLSYKKDVEYTGIPYGSRWNQAHYVGWHVSPHTMINAANDVDSIFYDASYSELIGGAPFYSTVCSAFATMCDGWECPQTNAGFFYDPDVETYYSYKPILGQIYTDMYSHCVIPSKIARIGKDTAISAFEAIKPVSSKTVRFMSVKWKDIWEWWNTAAGQDYYDTYGYVVHNPKSKKPIPYFDIENATITNGSARPFKGDKSVYTSAEESVKINIKNDLATVLYLENQSGEITSIPIDGDNVDIKTYLGATGIYYVYTDADSVKESFEYIVVTPITCTVNDDSITFSDNDFWYASCYVTGHKQFRDPKYQKMTACVLARENGNYSDWFNGYQKIVGVSGIFRKGVYGAYNVPFEEITP